MNKYNTKERCIIPTLECAKIIDRLLSSGEIIETQDIYDELEKIYHWVQEFHINVLNNYEASLKSNNVKDKDKRRKDYEYKCSQGYSYSVSKDALPRLKREILRQGLDPDLILRTVDGEYNKKKNRYQYTIKGFSAFSPDVDYSRKAQKKRRTANTIALFKDNAVKLLMGQQERSDVGVLPRDIDSTVKSLIDILYQLKDESYNTAFNDHLERLSKLKKERPENWITSFLNIIVEVKNEFRSLSSNIAYADLLIEYADFIINYSVPKELLPDEINDDLVDFAQGLYMGAISRSIENNNKVKQISYLIKYGDFLIKTFQYDLLRDISSKVLRLCESIRETTNIEKEYASALNLYAVYLRDSIGDIEAEPYFEKALKIRAQLAGYNVETFEKVSDNRPSIEDLYLLSRSMNNLASVYLRLYPNVPTKEHLSLFLKSYNIIRECAKREPMLYRTHLASTLYNVSASYIRNNKYDVAIKYLEKALKIDKELVLKSPEVHQYAINYSDDLERISGLYLWIIRDYIEAEEAAIEAVSSIENLYTYNHQVYLYTYVDKLYWLSNVYNEIGKCDEALDKSLCSLAILESANTCEYQTEKWIINIKNLLAEIYVKKLMYNEADAYSLDAFIIAKNLYIRAKTKENFDHYKLATKTRISVLKEMANYDAAESVISEFIALLNSHFGCSRESQILDFLKIKQELALIYRQNKNCVKALVIYEELRNVYIKHYKSTISYADFLVEYALCYKEAGQRMEYVALLNDAIFEYCSIEDQTILVKKNAATAYLHLALAISVDGDYEEAFESYEQSISLYNKVYRTEPLSVVGYLALAHRYYGLTLQDSGDIVKALEHYITAIDYYIEYDEDISEINEVISELLGVISMLPEDVSQNIINLTYMLINKCKQLDKNVDMESLERIEIYLQFYKKSN